MNQVINVPFSGQLIGQGFNSETGNNVGTALEVDNVFTDPSADGADAKTAFDLVKTQEQLMDSLGISAALDGRIGLFSGGAKMSFAEEHTVNSFSTFIAGRSFIQNALKHGRGFRLTEDAKAVLRSGGVDAFKKAFGDRFVRALGTGGEFCIIARVTSVSEENQADLAVALNGAYNGLVNKAEFSAAFKKANLETRERTDVSVRMFQFGGVGSQLAFTGPDADAIIDRLKQLPQFVHDHPGGLHAELATYDTIPIPIPSFEESEDRSIVLNDCVTQKGRILNALSDLTLALDPKAPEWFDGLPSRDENIRLQQAYKVVLNALMAHAIRVSTGQMEIPQLFVANPPPPALTLIKKPFVRESSIALMLEWIQKNDPTAAPFFAVPAGAGLAEPNPGPPGSGGQFVVFNSPLRRIFDPPVRDTFGPTGAIFTHPKFGTHYVYGFLFQRYECRYKLCFGNAGAHMGYPIADQVFDNQQNQHVQLFENGSLSLEFGDVTSAGVEIETPNPFTCFEWKP